MSLDSHHTYDLALLLAQAEIRDVIRRLARAQDRHDKQVIVSCYHADGFDDHGSFQGSPPEFADWAIAILKTYQSHHHFVGPPLIDVNGEVAMAETYCYSPHVTYPDAGGNQQNLLVGLRYVDRFEKRGERWLIARRTCVFDWEQKIAYRPGEFCGHAFTDGCIQGQRNPTDFSFSEP